MKTLTPLLLLLLTLVVCGGRCSDEEAESHDISTSTPHTSTSVARGEEAKQKEKAEREGQVEGQDVEALEGGDDEGDAPSSEAVKKSLAAARLPRPEALQGGRRGRSRQGGSLGTPQVLPGLHLGRIPPSCALCSRERNLCRIISGIFTRSPLPYGYSLVTPVPAGVCNLTITEMKPSKNFFALRRSDGTYVLNGNWNIQAAGEYPAAGTTFFYTPSDEDHGEQLSSPGPLKEPIDFMLISQSPNHGVKYEYRVPLPEYLGGNTGGLGPPSSGLKPPTGGLGLQTGGVRPNIGGSGIGHGVANPNPGQLTPFQPLPQGNPNMNPRNPNFRIRNPNIGGVNPNVPGLFPYGTGGTGGSLGPITPVLTPVTSGGNVGFNTSGVSFPPISTVGADPAGSPRRNPPFPGIPLDPSTSTGSRSSGIPGVPPHGQPITPLGSTTKTTGTLPLPWTPTYGSQEGGGRGVPLGTPFVPGQQYPRTSAGGGGGGGTPVQRYPGQVRPDGTGHDGSSHDSGGGSMGLTPSRDTGLLPEFPKNSVPLRTIPIPQPGTPRGRRPPADVPSHHRYPITGETISTTPADTHRTRHQHGSKLGQGRRKGNGKPHDPVFDSGVQLTQPNATPSFSSSNRTVPVSTVGRRGKGGGRRHEKHEGAGTVLAAGGGKRHRKGRRGRHRKQGPRFQWAEKGYTPCSRSCGGGNKTVILSCERRRNKKVVSDRRCSHLPRPEKRPAMCNLTPCPATWLPGDWGPCSVTCGMGVQTRPLICKQVVSPTLTMMVAEGACLSPPTVPTSQVCEMPRCSSTTPEWEAEPWGNCSAPCGLGTRMRQVRCLVAGMPASEEPCDDNTKPQQEQVCDMGSCAINTWFFSKWAEECSESCGTGVQTRRVHCLAGGGDVHDQCPASSRPDVSRPCRGESGCGGQWFAGPWSGCSVDCGTGRDSRPVLCVVFNRERWRVSHDANCKLEARPQDTRECNPQPCTPEWYTSEWSQCSASCDGGVRRREVTCLDASQRPSADCFNSSKPDTRQPCHLHPCGLQPSTAPPADAASNRTHTGDTASSQDVEGTDDTYNADDVTEDPEVDGATDEEVSERADEVGVTDDERPAQEEEEEEEDEGEGEENELVVEETTGSALNVIPDKDAQGDESVSDDEDEEERDKEDEEEEKKKKKKKKKEKRKNRDKQDKDGSESTEGTRREPSSADTPACIDRIKNCHLVFRARLCRLRYYNKLCCRTCSNT